MNFEEIVEHTISAVTRCLFRALSGDENNRLSPHDHTEINREFGFLHPISHTRQNTFLTRRNVGGRHTALFPGPGGKTATKETRISAIVSQYLRETLEQVSETSTKEGNPQREDFQAARFMSPLFVVQQILTDPNATETKQIASFYIRVWIIRRFSVSVSLHPDTHNDKSTDKLVTFQHLDELYKSIGKYAAGRDNFSKSGNPEHFLVTLLAAEGLLENRIRWSKNEAEKQAVAFNGSLEAFQKLLWDDSEFRLSSRHLKLPAIADIANLVFGVPIAISGLNELLNGGLKQGAGEGTVTLVRGGAGTGKTTLCISVQRAFEALGIPTIFISSEESESAVLARRQSVLNIPQKNHSAYGEDSASFEVITTYSMTEDEGSEKPGISRMVHAIAERLSHRGLPNLGPAQFSRLLVVIDGIHNYIDPAVQKNIRELIEECRATNTHVLISSSDEWAHNKGMEYFVDNFIRVKSDSISEPMPHVERQIQLVKTRHQSSAIGEHWMQFKDEGDLSFTPNFSVILRTQSKAKTVEPDTKKFSVPFALDYDPRHSSKRNNKLISLKHYDKSMTLIYGRGSSNKTSLSLRLLCAPNIAGGNLRKKILVVSFLANEAYYQAKRKSFCEKLEVATRKKIALERGLKDEIGIGLNDIEDSIGESLDVELDTLHFTPGMISAEEVYSEIASRISHSEITQSRYSGILIDGMHNVFVQFPQIEGHPELWSALMNLTRRVGIKSVWTFTDFEVWGAKTLTTVDYESSRHKPLLTALSQSIDYGFAVVPSTQVQPEGRHDLQPDLFEVREPGVFVVSAFMAHEQATPHEFLLWNRIKEEFVVS